MAKAYPPEHFQSADPLTVELAGGDRTIRIGQDSISLVYVVPAYVIYFAAAFQIGYFSTIGREFLSLVGPGDWLFICGVMLFPICVAWPLISGLHEIIALKLEDGTFHTSALYKVCRFTAGIPIWGVFVVAVALAIGGLLQFFDLFYAFIVASIAVICIAIIVELAEIHARHGRVLLKDIAKLTVILGFLLIGVGYLYAEHGAGRRCSMVVADGVLHDGLYLRAVGDGHLMKMGRRVFFIPKDKVKEIFCGRF